MISLQRWTLLGVSRHELRQVFSCSQVELTDERARGAGLLGKVWVCWARCGSAGGGVRCKAAALMWSNRPQWIPSKEQRL